MIFFNSVEFSLQSSHLSFKTHKLNIPNKYHKRHQLNVIIVLTCYVIIKKIPKFSYEACKENTVLIICSFHQIILQIFKRKSN